MLHAVFLCGRERESDAAELLQMKFALKHPPFPPPPKLERSDHFISFSTLSFGKESRGL
jgi:hypothetical protein